MGAEERVRQALGGGGGRRVHRVAGGTDGGLRDTFGEGVLLVAAGTPTQRAAGGAVVRAGGETLCAEGWGGGARGGLRVREDCSGTKVQ